jgi:two-component system nitrogen regulation response regulator GlnG
VVEESLDFRKQPLAELVRRRLKVLFDELGTHRPPDLYRRVMGEVERVLITEALQRAGGSQIKAAAILGIHRNTLRLRMRKLTISVQDN